jgi:hypothetical protein
MIQLSQKTLHKQSPQRNESAKLHQIFINTIRQKFKVSFKITNNVSNLQVVLAQINLNMSQP